MKNKLPYVLAAAVLLGLAVFAQTRETGKLTLTLTPVKQNVLLLEPIALQFKVANPSERAQAFKGDIDLYSIKLSIRKPNGEVVTPTQLKGLSGPNPWMREQLEDRYGKKTIEPGANRTWNEHLEFKLREYFGEVGEYQLKVTYEKNKQVLSTDWVTLHVEQPVGEDLAAYERLRALDEVNDGVFEMGVTKNRKAFIEQFPNSKYADYSRYFAAKSLSKKDKDKAKEYLQAIEGKEGFAFAEDAKKRLQELNASRPSN